MTADMPQSYTDHQSFSLSDCVCEKEQYIQRIYLYMNNTSMFNDSEFFSTIHNKTPSHRRQRKMSNMC